MTDLSPVALISAVMEVFASRTATDANLSTFSTLCSLRSGRGEGEGGDG